MLKRLSAALSLLSDAHGEYRMARRRSLCVLWEAGLLTWHYGIMPRIRLSAAVSSASPSNTPSFTVKARRGTPAN